MNVAKRCFVLALWAVLGLHACGDDNATPDAQTPGADAGNAGDAVCAVRCSDGLFCNGDERCDPSDPAADDHGCVTTPRDCDDGLACTADLCRENLQRCVHAPPDVDQDGHFDARCVNDDGDVLGDDCDDDDVTRYPGNPEVCTGDPIDARRDEDCDPRTFGDKDADGDGSIDAVCCNTDLEGVERCGLDCDDTALAVHAKQPELCDGIDNDCDDVNDEVANAVAWFVDEDGDGFGAGAEARSSCAPEPGYSFVATDCDDGESSVNPATTEACDGIDNDCDDGIDERLIGCDSAPTEPTKPRVNECLNDLDDCDADARCVDTADAFVCECPAGFVGDGRGEDGCACQMSGPDVSCDGVDQDCDGRVDEAYAATSCDAADAAWLSACEDAQETCRCVVTAGADVPADSADTNCDGIDGARDGSIFVAPGDAADCVAPLGTSPEQPCLSVQAAIERAASEGKVVIVSVGHHAPSSPLRLREGVSVYGGFDLATGRLASSGGTVIRPQGSGHRVAAIGAQINATTVVSRVQFEATTPTSPGFGSYGLVCDGCAGLVLRDVSIVAEAGAVGVGGADGTAGDAGTRGTQSSWSDTGPASGASGGSGRPGADTGPGDNDGHRGGNGGTAQVCTFMQGDTYYAGLQGQPVMSGGGGAGATAGGTPAQVGPAGAAAMVSALGGRTTPAWNTIDDITLWLIDGSGDAGVVGNAGRGGGGGRAYCDYGAVNSWYWRGAGGGGGGQAGPVGLGGGAGGSSLGLLLRNSAGIQLINVDVRAGAGGVGGRGGTGGDGGDGGPGGAVASNGPVGAPAASGGATGGRGSGGGGGGGGAGGASIAVLIDGATALDVDLTGVTRARANMAAAGGDGGAGGNLGEVNQGRGGSPGDAGIVCDVFRAESSAQGACL